MKKLFVLFLFTIMFFSSAWGRALAQIYPMGNATCPVMPGERAKQKFYVDFQGKRVYLCCRNCVIKFKRDPEKYIGNLKKL